MASNADESTIERVAEFFTQRPEDHDYEKQGGDATIPVEFRTADPGADLNHWNALKARGNGGLDVLAEAIEAIEALKPS